MAQNVIEIVIRAIDDASKVFNDIGKKAEKATRDLGQHLQSAGKSMTNAGKSFTKGVTTPVLGLGTAATVAVASFDDSMSKVQALSGATGKDLDDLRSLAKDLGATTAHSASDAADAMGMLAQAGYKTNEILEVTPQMLYLASAGGLDLATTASITTNTMNAFQMSADEAARATDVLAKAQAETDTNVTELGHAMTYAATAAHDAGMDIEQTSAVLGMFADAGIKGGRAGTTFNAMLRDLRKANAEGKLAIEGTNIALYNQDGSMRDLGSVMADVEKATEGMTAAQRDAALSAIFGEQSMRGASIMLAKGSDEYKKLEKAMYEADETAINMSKTMEDNVAGAFRELKSRTERVLIDIGEQLVPIIQDVVIPMLIDFGEKVSELVERFANLDEETQRTILTVIAIAVAIGPVLIIVGKLTSAVGKSIEVFGKMKDAVDRVTGVASRFNATLLANPTAWVVAGIVALIAIIVLLWRNWDEVSQWLSESWDWIKEKASEIFGGIGETIGEAWDWVKEKTSEIWDSIKDYFVEKWNAIRDWAADIWNSVAETIGGAWQSVKDKTMEIWDSIMAVVMPIWESIYNVASTIFNAIYNVIWHVWFVISTITRAVWNVIYTIIYGLVMAIVEFMTPIFIAIAEFVTAVWEKIKEVTSTVWNAIKDFFVETFTAIKEFFVEVWTAISEFFIETWNFIYKIAVEVWTSIKEFFVELWEGIKEVAIAIWTPIQEFFTETWTAISETATSVWTSVKEFFSETWEAIKERIITVWTSISEFFLKIWSSIEELAITVYQSIADFLRSIWEGIRDVALSIWNGIKDTLHTIWNGILILANTEFNSVKDLISFIWNWIKDITSTIWNGIKDTLSTIWNSIKNIVDTTFNTIRNIVSGIWNAISSISATVWNGIKNTITNIIVGLRNTISRIFNGIKTGIINVWLAVKIGTSRVWEGIVQAVKAPINVIIGLVNGMIGALNRVRIPIPKVPSWIPGIGGKGGGSIGFNIPKIPKLARGGLAVDETLAIIGEGVDQEAVLPLNNRVMSQLGSEIGKHIGCANSSISVNYRNLAEVARYTNQIKNTLNIIQNSINNIANRTLSAIQKITSGMKVLQNTIVTTFNTVRSTILKIFSDIKTGSVNTWLLINKEINRTAQIVKASANAVAGFANNVVGTLNMVQLSASRMASWIANIDGKISRSSIGQEAVLPLNNQAVAKLGSEIGKHIEPVSSPVEVDYRKLAEAIRYALGDLFDLLIDALGVRVVVENMNVRDDYDIERIAQELMKLKRRNKRVRGSS